MRSFTYCIILFGAGLFLFPRFGSSVRAQEQHEHALKDLRTQIEKSGDKEKVPMLNQLAEKYLSVDTNKAIFYARQAYDLARKIEDKKNQTKALLIIAQADESIFKYSDATETYLKALENEKALGHDSAIAVIMRYLGQDYTEMTQYSKAEDFLQQSVDIFRKLGNNRQVAESLFSLGHNSYLKGNLKKTLDYFNKSLAIDLKNGDDKDAADVYNYLGIVYYDLGIYEKALSFYLKSLKIVEDMDDKQGIAHALNNIGIVYYDWGNLEKALEYYQKSMKIEQVLGNKAGIGGSYNNIGIIYSDWGQNDLAIDYYRKALNIYKEYRDFGGIADALNNMGESYAAMHQYDTAIAYMTRSLELELKHGNEHGTAQSYNGIAKVYFEKKNYNQALTYNYKAARLVAQSNLLSVKLTIDELYYKIYEALNNPVKELKYYKKYVILKDSIYNRKFHQRLADLQLKFELDQKDKENGLQQQKILQKNKEAGNRRLYLILIFVLLLVLGILVFIDIKSKTGANKRLREINVELALQKEKLSETLANLTKSEEKYKNLVTNSPTGILYIDTEGNIIEINKKMLDILGSPGEEATKEINCLTYPPLQKAGFSKDILDCIQKRETIYSEKYYKTKWGKYVILKIIITPISDSENNVGSLIINVEDITIAKKSEKRIKESEEKYRMLVENSLQAMLVVREGKIIFANSRMEQITHYPFAELAGKGKKWLSVLIHPEDLKKSVKDVNDAFNGKTDKIQNEYRIVRKDGEVRWIETLGSMINYLGKPSVLLVAIDITERKKAESILIESEEKLRELNAMKDKFFSIIAHDLKNPFNAILGFANFLFEANENLNELQRKKYIKNIVVASENTFKLLQNLLDWSQTQTGSLENNPEAINVKEIVNENLNIFRSTAVNKQIFVQNNVPSDIVAFADENMIKTVVRNLLSNALKFTGRGGHVEVTATQSDSIVEIAVSDTGVGIGKKDLGRLFRIDDQVKSEGTDHETGSGLGLILCKEFIEKNGGKIRAESQSGKGSKFTFTLPRP